MKLKNLISILLFSISTIILLSCQEKVKCQGGINILPMYGKVAKCPQQLESDRNFLAESDKNEPNRSKAAIQTIDNGWYYIHYGDYNNAMKRINQAWLLDSTNVVVYSSFSVILDLTNKTDDAIKMLDYTLNLIKERKDPQNPDNSDISTISNYSLTEFVVNNIPFTYKKTNNLSLSQYMYKKLDSLNISGVDNEKLKNILETQIPELANKN